MRRTLVVLSLTASLATAPASLLDRVWTLLSVLWEESPPAHQPQTKAGCGGDPNGLCQPSPQPQTPEGCGGDPNGLCQPGS